MKKAIVIGVGPDRGLGAQLWRRFAAERLRADSPLELPAGAVRQPDGRRN